MINDDIISISSWKAAMKLVYDIDMKDLPNIALTIELSAKLWTNDVELKTGLRAKGFDDFIDL